MKKRIVFVTYVYEKGGGTEKHLEDLIVRLDLSKVDPVILCFGPDVYTLRIIQKYGLKIEIHKARKGKTFFSYWLPFVVLRPHALVFVNGVLGCFPWYAYLAAKCSAAKRVFAIEHLIADRPPPLGSCGGLWQPLRSLVGWRARQMWKFKLEALLCRRVICVSRAVSDRLINDYEFPEGRTVVVRNGVDLTHYSASGNGNRGKDDDMPVTSEYNVLCVARLSTEKRIDTLLEAMAKVLRKMPRCKCTIVGDGPLKENLLQKAEELGLSDSIRFIGHVDEVRPFYEAADLFVLSSAKEGLPLVLLEAMAFAVPCIATNVGGNAEVIAHDETGLIVEPGNPEELANAILDLIANADLRRQMGEQGKKRVQYHFNVNNTMARLSEIILN